MNIPEFYLVEPYNAYAPKGRKKHPHEIIEEQALLERIIAEQIALQEANSRTLPQDAPPISAPTVGNSAGAIGGAGGQPPFQFFHPEGDAVNFDRTPSSGFGPLTVVFTNLTQTPEFDSYLWEFGDGTTSTEANPTHVYQSGSAAASYAFTASLQVTNSYTGVGVARSPYVYTIALPPQVTSSFTYVTSSGVGPVLATFTNTSVNTSQTPTTTYLWKFVRNGTTTTSTTTNPTYTAHSGSVTASLQATGSYGLTSLYTQSFFVPAPTLTATVAVTTSSVSAPSTASFTNAVTYNGKGTLTYLWTYGSGSLTSTSATPSALIYTAPGNYTASLQVTESSYNITTFVTRSWKLA